MNKITNVTYRFEEALNVHSLCEVNRSFDKGVLKIAYHGKNRNGTYISKEAFENALPSLANVPVVTHYLRKDDELGGHDMELITGEDGKLYMVYVTEPVGVVPSSPNCWWEEVEETNGDVHEYLCVEVLLWKRQEAYKLIKESGVVGQSMEITINDGHDGDGMYCIDSFIFTALCLLGDEHEPCFESASLNVFGLSSFQAQYQEMLNEFKLAFAQVSGTNPVQGGEEPMNNELDVNVPVEDAPENIVVDVDTDTSSVEAVEAPVDGEGNEGGEGENFEETPAEPTVETPTEDGIEGSGADNPVDDSDGVDGEPSDEPVEEQFSLTLMDKLGEIQMALASKESILDPWGYEMPRFCFVDVQDSDVIFWDAKENWMLMGAPIVESGDKISINFEQMKRKKVSYEDFIDGSSANDWMNQMFTSLSNRLVSTDRLNELQSQYDVLNGKYTVLYDAEQARLDAERREAVAGVFEKFEKLLGGDAEFEALKSEEHNDVEALENKCFSLYGKKKAVFTVADKKQKNVSLVIDACSEVEEKKLPYGNKLFAFLDQNK